jgi:hypothetical protein
MMNNVGKSVIILGDSLVPEEIFVCGAVRKIPVLTDLTRFLPRCGRKSAFK